MLMCFFNLIGHTHCNWDKGKNNISCLGNSPIVYLFLRIIEPQTLPSMSYTQWHHYPIQMTLVPCFH